MDKRCNALSIPEQLTLRKKAVDDVLAHPEWSLAQAVRHLKKTMRRTTAEMAQLSQVLPLSDQRAQWFGDDSAVRPDHPAQLMSTERQSDLVSTTRIFR